MLKVKFLFLCLLVSLAFQAQEISGEHTFRCIDIKNVEIVAENFVAEIDFGPIIKVVSGKSIKKHKSARLAKDEAYFNAIVDNEIDVLIDPIYAVRKKGKFLFVFGGYAEATVVDLGQQDALAAQAGVDLRLAAGADLATHDLAVLVAAFPLKDQFLDVSRR